MDKNQGVNPPKPPFFLETPLQQTYLSVLFAMPRKQNAKQRILDTAADLFGKRGYGSVGINEIIEKSETAKASFYNHYPSKERLCSAWLTAVHERSEAYHASLLNSDEPPIKIIENYFLALKPWLQNNEYRGCPYTNTASSLPEQSDLIQKNVAEHKNFQRDFFTQLVEKITPDAGAARQLGITLFLLYSGATTEAQNLRDFWPIDSAAKAAVDLCKATSP
jgi:AcrR family transcriptional regulator